MIDIKKIIKWREKHAEFMDYVGLVELDDLIRSIRPEYCNPPQREMGFTKFSEIPNAWARRW